MACCRYCAEERPPPSRTDRLVWRPDRSALKEGACASCIARRAKTSGAAACRHRGRMPTLPVPAVEIKKLRPGEVIGARDLRHWGKRRLAGRAGAGYDGEVLPLKTWSVCGE